MGKRKTQDEIIQGFIEKHGNKYDYSKVSYVEATSEVIVTCLQHGDFKITPNKHKLGQGCLECSIIENSKKKREKGAANIIRRIKEVHGEIYDLSEVVYDKMKSPVTIICKKHGRKQITPSSLIYGKCGCDECGRERSEAAKIRPLEDVLKQATQVHEGKYGYHKIENYTDTQAKYIFVCPVHGEFPQTMTDHLSGRGCKDCGKEMTGLKKRLPQEKVIERCTEVHGNRYDLSKIKYITDREPIEVVCKTHGSFFPLPINFIKKGIGCVKCSNERVATYFRNNPVGWSLQDWVKSSKKSKNFDSFKVYVIRCWNEEEEFYKIGRTFRTVKHRFRDKIGKYNYEVIKVEIGEAEDIYKLESEMKSQNKEFSYVPKNKFGGMYECFSINPCTIKNNTVPL